MTINRLVISVLITGYLLIASAAGQEHVHQPLMTVGRVLRRVSVGLLRSTS